MKTLRHTRMQLSIAALVYALTLTFGGDTADAVDLSISEIERLWKQRAADADPIKVTWSESRSQPLVGQDLSPVAQGGQSTLVSTVVPDAPSMFLLSGNRARYKTEILKVLPDGKIVPCNADWSFDGATSRSVISSKHDPKPGGAIGTDKRFDQFSVVSLKPILISYRTLSPLVLYRSTYTSSIENTREVIDGVSCQVIRLVPDRAPFVARVWIDSDRHAIPLRSTMAIEGRVMSDCRLYYDKQPNQGRLAGWEITSFNDDGKVIESSRASKVEVVAKPATTNEEFVITFPRGAAILDKRMARREIMFSLGGDRLVSRSEFERTWVGPAVAAISVLVFCAIALVAYRRYTRYGRASS